MSLVTESGREQLETARSAPDPEPIREDNADTDCVHCGQTICKQESSLHRLMRGHSAYRLNWSKERAQLGRCTNFMESVP